MPFAGYGAGSDLVVFNNLVAKVAAALPLGFIAAYALPRGMDVRLVAAVWMVGAGAVFGDVEAGQFFLPTRSPDPTDVWLGILASAAGLWLGRWLRAGYRSPEPRLGPVGQRACPVPAAPPGVRRPE